jgi:hypothetical protein
MSLVTVDQLHKSLNALFEKDAHLFAEPEMLSSFNIDLSEAKKSYPDNSDLKSFSDAEGKIKISSLIVLTERLKAILEAEALREFTEATPPPSPSIFPQPGDPW